MHTSDVSDVIYQLEQHKNHVNSHTPPLVALPPLVHNLPHWSRVHHLDRRRLGALTVEASAGIEAVENELREVSETLLKHRRDIDNQELKSVSETRISALEKSLEFLKQLHTDVLCRLHEEIDHLKRENKDLKFQLLVQRPTQGLQAPGADHTEDVILVNENKRLEAELEKEREANAKLMQSLREFEASRRTSTMYTERAAIPVVLPRSPRHPLTYSVHPLVIYPQTSQAHTPSAQECSNIIHLQHEKQEEYLNQLKCLREDVKQLLLTHQWPPDVELLKRLTAAAGELNETSIPRHPKKITNLSPLNISAVSTPKPETPCSHPPIIPPLPSRYMTSFARQYPPKHRHKSQKNFFRL